MKVFCKQLKTNNEQPLHSNMKYGKVKNIITEVLSNNWNTLNKITFDYQKEDGTWENQSREAYDRGNGAAILLYNKEKRTVVLTKQFRMPTYVNGNIKME